EVLRPRIVEIGLSPVLTERRELVAYELRRGRLRKELVGGGEEKSLAPSRAPAEARGPSCMTRNGEIRTRRQRRLDVALAPRDCGNGADTLGHLSHRESLRKHDPERLRHRDHGLGRLAVRRPGYGRVDDGGGGRGRGGGVLRAAADRCDSEPAEPAEDEHEHDDGDEAAPRDLS